MFGKLRKFNVPRTSQKLRNWDCPDKGTGSTGTAAESFGPQGGVDMPAPFRFGFAANGAGKPNKGGA